MRCLKMLDPLLAELYVETIKLTIKLNILQDMLMMSKSTETQREYALFKFKEAMKKDREIMELLFKD